MCLILYIYSNYAERVLINFVHFDSFIVPCAYGYNWAGFDMTEYCREWCPPRHPHPSQNCCHPCHTLGLMRSDSPSVERWTSWRRQWSPWSTRARRRRQRDVRLVSSSWLKGTSWERTHRWPPRPVSTRVTRTLCVVCANWSCPRPLPAPDSHWHIQEVDPMTFQVI